MTINFNESSCFLFFVLTIHIMSFYCAIMVLVYGQLVGTTLCQSHTSKNEHKKIGNIFLTGSRKSIAYRFRKLYTVNLHINLISYIGIMYNLVRPWCESYFMRSEKDEQHSITAHTNTLATLK